MTIDALNKNDSAGGNTGTGSVKYTPTNTSPRILWDSRGDGSVVYELFARSDSVDLTTNPAATDQASADAAYAAWVLPDSGVYKHDPVAAHFYDETHLAHVIGSTAVYRPLATATWTQKQATPIGNAGWSDS